MNNDSHINMDNKGIHPNYNSCVPRTQALTEESSLLHYRLQQVEKELNNLKKDIQEKQKRDNIISCVIIIITIIFLVIINFM